MGRREVTPSPLYCLIAHEMWRLSGFSDVLSPPAGKPQGLSEPNEPKMSFVPQHPCGPGCSQKKSLFPLGAEQLMYFSGAYRDESLSENTSPELIPIFFSISTSVKTDLLPSGTQKPK